MVHELLVYQLVVHPTKFLPFFVNQFENLLTNNVVLQYNCLQISLYSIFQTNHALDKLLLFIGVFKFAFNESYHRLLEKYQTVLYLLLEY